MGVQNLDSLWNMVLEEGMAYGIKIIGAIVIFVVGKWIAKKLSGLARNLMERSNVDPTLSNFIASVLDVLMIILVVLAAVKNLGVDTTSFIAILGAMGLAIGMAMQGTFGNIGAGVILILFRPFKIGDTVTIAGSTGKVKEITLFNTTLIDDDKKVIMIPNSAVAAGTIIKTQNQDTLK